ncbi:class I SAM-dependent methyltransferase [Limibacillus halophilus]|jgi:ubiquinone/menaquinone biosynthesis C-methylase UbiE
MQDPRSAETARSFSQQATAYAESKTHAFGEDLDIVAAYAEPGQYFLCLDIASGPGHTAFRIASKASVVIGVDIAEGMLAKARELAAEQEITNVVFQKADAAALPFRDASFDLVTCRIAPHHFYDVPGFLSETRRVLREDGRLVMEDNLSPDQPEAAAFLHDLDQSRDPTHVRCYSQAEWAGMLEAAGMRLARDTIFESRQTLADWFERMSLGEETRSELSQRVEAAPASVAAELFLDPEGGRTLLRRRKYILRAEKR